MPTINIGDVMEVVQTWDTPLASVAQNVWHLEMVSGAGADSDDVLPAVLTQQQVAFATIDNSISDQFEAVLLELRLWDFALNRYDGVDAIAMTLMKGLSTADFEPHGVAALGRILTEFSRRQGRQYIPGVTDTVIVGGLLSAGFEAVVATYLSIFDTDIGVTGGNLSWCTFNTEPLSPVFETTSVAIQTVIANSLPSYLGKRKPGVGL